jgi:hypothetical protein
MVDFMVGNLIMYCSLVAASIKLRQRRQLCHRKLSNRANTNVQLIRSFTSEDSVSLHRSAVVPPLTACATRCNMLHRVAMAGECESIDRTVVIYLHLSQSGGNMHCKVFAFE